MTGVRLALSMVVAGWLANAFATPDRSVRAGIEAYDQKEWDRALEQFTIAEERLGERPEIHFDKGLVHLAKGDTENAQKAFERGSESERNDVRASSFYELGNIAFDAEQWDLAVQHYIDALKARPEHATAKWNLELALQRQREEQEKQEQEKQEQEKQEQEKQEQDSESQDDEGDEDEDQDQDEDPKSQQDESQDGQEDQQDQENPEPNPSEPGEDESQPPPAPEEGDQGSPPPADEQKGGQPRALDRADIERALKELDEQDEFRLGRPLGPPPAVDKDW